MKLLMLTITLLVATLANAQLYRNESYLLRQPYISFNLTQDRMNSLKNQTTFMTEYRLNANKGLKPLLYNWGTETFDYHSVAYLILNDDYHTYYTVPFLKTLMTEKSKIMQLYQLKNNTYNKLAAMSFAIFGVESKFGRNPILWGKELAQPLVSAAKGARNLFEIIENEVAPSENKKPLTVNQILSRVLFVQNSRGPTQIKNIPIAIQKAYPDISPDSLIKPSHAAVATIGFLAETLRLIRGLKNRQIKKGIPESIASLSYVTEENIFDYIPYIYSGRMFRLFNGPGVNSGPTVTDNKYIQEMKQHLQLLYFMETP